MVNEGEFVDEIFLPLYFVPPGKKSLKLNFESVDVPPEGNGLRLLPWENELELYFAPVFCAVKMSVFNLFKE